MVLDKCPHCDGKHGVYRNIRAFGWCEEHFDVDGNAVEIITDNLQFTKPQRFYCMGCGKHIPGIKMES